MKRIDVPPVHKSEEESLGGCGRTAAGGLFLLLGLISAASSLASASVAERSQQIYASLLAALISLACLLWAYRLLFDRPRKDGGLLSPITLRVFAVIYVGLPIASLATGAWRDNHIHPLFLVPQGLLYFAWGLALWRLATRRRGHAERCESRATMES